jgi:hypothetical protein
MPGGDRVKQALIIAGVVVANIAVIVLIYLAYRWGIAAIIAILEPIFPYLPNKFIVIGAVMFFVGYSMGHHSGLQKGRDESPME